MSDKPTPTIRVIDAAHLAHECDTGGFDRTLCPEPCGKMHSFCATCGDRQDPCIHDRDQEATR